MPPPPPELADDLLGEVFLRLPPDDLACLLRASLTCRRWRRILADPAFRRRHRALHRTPSVLGFFHAVSSEIPYLSRYVPVSPASRLPAGHDLPGWLVLDCRHGRALFATPSRSLGTHPALDFLVWDPLTGEQHHLPRPSPTPTDDLMFNAAVLCAAGVEACDHRGCHGEAFRVVFIFTRETHSRNNSAYVGDALYFCGYQSHAFEYQLGAHRLSVVPPPPVYLGPFISLVSLEDGGLCCTEMKELRPSLRLRLWSREAGPDGVAHWALGRGFELQTILPNGALLAPQFSFANPPGMPKAIVLGFAEGTDVIFVGTDTHISDAGAVYMLQLNSEKARKVFEGRNMVFPYTSFCITVADAACTDKGAREVV